jgi:hypothetical protein
VGVRRYPQPALAQDAPSLGPIDELLRGLRYMRVLKFL